MRRKPSAKATSRRPNNATSCPSSDGHSTKKLLAGLHAGFTAEYLAAPVALFTRIAVQPRLDIRTGQCGTVAPKSGSYQPADAQSLRELQRSLRRQARTLLRRAAEHLEAHAAEFPGYDPDNNILKRCTTDGNLIQTH